MTQTPTDALRLVPVEPTEAMLDAVKPWPEHWPPYDQATVSARSAYDIDRAVLRSNWTHMLSAAPASPLPGGGPACQLCANKIEGWICQGCGSHFYENDAGALVLNTIPAAPTGDA